MRSSIDITQPNDMGKIRVKWESTEEVVKEPIEMKKEQEKVEMIKETVAEISPQRKENAANRTKMNGEKQEDFVALLKTNHASPKRKLPYGSQNNKRVMKRNASHGKMKVNNLPPIRKGSSILQILHSINPADERK